VRRLQMYELMLSKMKDEQKMHVHIGITNEILGGALIEGSDLWKAVTVRGDKASFYESAALVICDALTVLQSPTMRVGKATASTGQEEDLDESTLTGNNNNTRAQFAVSSTLAMGRLTSNLSRQLVIERVLPILINLKTLLQHHRSPLLKHLMAYLVYVFRMYKTEVKQHLVEKNGDATLLQEVEYDAKRLASSQAEEDAAAIAAEIGEDADDSGLGSFNKSLYVSRDESQD
jgi:hypothetical protein